MHASSGSFEPSFTVTFRLSFTVDPGRAGARCREEACGIVAAEDDVEKAAAVVAARP